jgi:hypothetical protein
LVEGRSGVWLLTGRSSRSVPLGPRSGDTAGDTDDAVALYREYYAPLMGFVTRMTGGDRQADQLGIGQPGPAAPALACRNHMIVDLHMECGQEGVQVVRHSRSWTPSCHVLADRHTVFKESII